MSEVLDWYPTNRGDERLMFGNIEEKIDTYTPKYQFLTAELLAKVHAMCGTFNRGLRQDRV